MMKKTMLLLFLLLTVCVSLFVVACAKGKTDNALSDNSFAVYPDNVLSGNTFAIQFDPKTKSAIVSPYGSAKTVMIKGDNTGSSELKIGKGGSIDYDLVVKQFGSNTEVYVLLSSDKEVVAKASFRSITGSAFTAFLRKMESSEYIVGGAGPAGGIVFYDKGNYNGGWRYLEAAPADLRVVLGTPSVDKSDPWYDLGSEEIIFGYYRMSYDGDNLFVNGRGKLNEGTAIGRGKKNTELLVKAMGSSAYSTLHGSDKTAEYAAKLCSDLVFNGFDDWFLPSIDELNLMYENLKINGLGGFADKSYWSSTEYYVSFVNDPGEVWIQKFGSGVQGCSLLSFKNRVRPIRAF